VAILWEGADRMLDGHLRLLLSAVERISWEADRVWRYVPPIRLLVCLVGDGPNFPDDYSTRPLFGTEAAEIPVAVIYLPRVNGEKPM
jgi:hypothetical protein